MAIFHSTTKIIGRAAGRSTVAAAAYRAGETLTNERDGITHDYTRKRGIEYSEIMIPENATEEYKNRETLWNAVEKIEKRKDAQLAREIELGLPNELNRQSQIDLLKEYIQENFVNRGMCADFSLHDKGDGNPHAHIMLTMRSIDENGNWMGKQKKEYILDKHGNKQYDAKKKTYKCKSVPTNDWNNIENVTQWRENWANICNREFENKGIEERIDHRSYQEQGIRREPTIHLGSAAHQLEKRGIRTKQGDINREAQSINYELEAIKEKLVATFAEIQEVEAALIGAELPEVPAAREGLFSKVQNIRERTEQTPATSQAEIQEPRTATEPEAPLQWIAEDSPDQIAQRMSNLRDNYLSVDRQINDMTAKLTKQHEDIRSIEARYNRIEKYSRDINIAKTNINQLQERRDGLGMLKSSEKKELDRQIEILKQSRNQAIDGLRRDFGIEPSQAQNERQRLAQQSKAIKQQIEKDRPELDALKAERQKYELEYKTERVLTLERPDKKEIDFLLSRRGERPRGTVERINLEKLNSISQSELKKIEKFIGPGRMPRQLLNIAKQAIRTADQSVES